MIVHPVLEFAAYALTVIPLAAALSYLITDDRKWTEISLTWSRFAWLFYTLAIGIGALWAYNVLGWGGYWAWDPVETANLIPWIALTGFLHAQSHYRKNRGYTFVAPLLAISVFLLTIFATFETRSGLVESVLHSFTGAGSQVVDPGDKLVAILTGNPGANFFMVIMLATIIAAGALFVWRFSEIRRREGLTGAAAYVPYVYIAFLAGLAIFAILNVVTFTSYGLSAARTMGMGNLGPGLLVLTLVLIGIPLIWILFTSREDEENEEEDAGTEREKDKETGEAGDKGRSDADRPKGLADYINAKNLMLVTVVIFIIWFIITVLLMLMGVNGLEAAVFEDRLPLLLVPLLIVMAVCLTWRYLGRVAGLYLIIILAIVTIIAYGLLYGNVISIYATALAAALFATCYRIVRVGLPKKRGLDLPAIGGILLVIAGILGMVTWSNPPRIILLSLSLELPLAYAPVGFIFGLAALIGGLTTLRGSHPRLSLLFAILGILSFGYFFIGTILSAVALIIMLASSSSFSRATKSQSLKPVLKATGTYLIHLGAVLLIIGYVSSGYMAEEKDFNPSTIGSLSTFSSVDFNDYSISIEGSSGEDTDDDGFFETMNVDVAVTRDNSLIGTATMQFYWMVPANPAESPHYMINIDVLKTSTKDLYFIGYAFNTPDDGWIQAMGDTGVQFSSSNVQEIAFQVSSLPLMGVLWGGMWIMSIGILLVAVTGYRSKRKRDAAKKAVKDDKAESAEEAVDEKALGGKEEPAVGEDVVGEGERQRLKKEEDYERILEKELADMEDGE
jgi:ABC-type transport system involved in cytochrome c biogenesis permease subunit